MQDHVHAYDARTSRFLAFDLKSSKPQADNPMLFNLLCSILYE